VIISERATRDAHETPTLSNTGQQSGVGVRINTKNLKHFPMEDIEK